MSTIQSLKNPSRLVVAVVMCAWASGLQAQENPPAHGFNAASSDSQAIAIADQVMEAMGGRASWDATRYIAWNFFGMRTHVWDKWTGDLRFQQNDRVVLMNIHSKQGRAWRGGEEITDPDALAQQLDGTYKAWINDSYWLAMPYKLKDSGVTLKHKGASELPDGRACDVLELTFENIGVTPQNKYDVYVSRDSHLVERWSYYPERTDAEPRFSTPWANWKQHGKILLSGDRGQRQLSEIRVFDELPREVFESPETIDLSSYPVAR